MVELQKTEQRGQAVKRLRSLFDMHRVPFGAPENLNGLLASLRDDRHFAMDFWSVVGSLSADEGTSLSDEEMLDTVIESAAGVEPTSLPQELQPEVTELRQLLSGVDIERPVNLPDAISKPVDDPLPHLTTLIENAFEPVRSDEQMQEARRSIGEMLARLEQTSRELRERLATIDARNKAVDVSSAIAASPVIHAAEAEPARTQSVSSADANTTAAPSSAEVSLKRDAPAEVPRTQTGGERQPLPLTPQEAPVPIRERAVRAAPAARAAAVPPVANSQAEVFTPRPAYMLSQRGLAIPDPEDDPSIPTPLANYAAIARQSSGTRYGIAALMIAVLSAGAFFGARTQQGHALLSSTGSSLFAWYEGTKERLGVLKREATPQASPSESSTAAPAQVPSAPTQEQAPKPDQAAIVAPGTDSHLQTSVPQRRTPAPSMHQAPPVASHTNVASTRIPPPPKKHAEALVAAKARTVESPVASSDAVHVPAAAMARHLIASRVPVYPESAKAQDIEGPVVMDVVIAESGFVKGVRAVDGDKHLRAAAEEAVSKWRYIPYLQNGRAVEVVTTVRLDFRLP